MRNVILFDDDSWEHHLPLTYTRPTSELRCGILTISEKWQRALDANISYITQEYLANLFPIAISDDNWVVAGNVLPNPKLVRLINELSVNEALMFEDELVAARLSRQQFDNLIHDQQIDELVGYTLDETPVVKIGRSWQIFQLNGDEINSDFRTITKGRTSQSLDKSSTWDGKQIFIEEGAEVKHSIIDATTGPVYIGKNVKILPGCMLKGPLAIGEGAVIKMGAKIYGPTTIGPYCTAGGEIKNSVLFAHSNKGHDGYLGNSVIGEWCNLGADTNSSNLRNDYAEVALWNHSLNAYENTGTQFCGLIMGDHSKSGINTMFNTGTVVGVSANVFGGGFLPRLVPSFSWGGCNELTEYRMEKAIQVAERVMSRRSIPLSNEQKTMLQEVYNLTTNQR